MLRRKIKIELCIRIIYIQALAIKQYAIIEIIKPKIITTILPDF